MTCGVTRVVWRDRLTGRKVSRRVDDVDVAGYVAALLNQRCAAWVRVEPLAVA